MAVSPQAMMGMDCVLVSVGPLTQLSTHQRFRFFLLLPSSLSSFFPSLLCTFIKYIYTSVSSKSVAKSENKDKSTFYSRKLKTNKPLSSPSTGKLLQCDSRCLLLQKVSLPSSTSHTGLTAGSFVLIRVTSTCVYSGLSGFR